MTSRRRAESPITRFPAVFVIMTSHVFPGQRSIRQNIPSRLHTPQEGFFFFLLRSAGAPFLFFSTATLKGGGCDSCISLTRTPSLHLIFNGLPPADRHCSAAAATHKQAGQRTHNPSVAALLCRGGALEPGQPPPLRLPAAFHPPPFVL